MPIDGQRRTVDTGRVVLGRIPARVVITHDDSHGPRCVMYSAVAPDPPGGWLIVSHKRELDLLSFHPGAMLQAGSASVSQHIHSGGDTFNVGFGTLNITEAPGGGKKGKKKKGKKEPADSPSQSIVIQLIMPTGMALDRRQFDQLGAGQITFE